MSFSEVQNPRALADLVDRFRKRFSEKKCMSPLSDHEGGIVSAHTLSLEAMLRKIAIDSHVYVVGQTRRFASDTFPYEIQRRGLRDVSVFNGFCQKHDRELFACLETEPYRFSRQQNFMLAYRAVARECYLKRKQLESLPSPHEYASMHGIKHELQFTSEAIDFQTACLKGAEDVETLKNRFDKLLLDKSWDRLITRVILFPNTPTVIATAAFQPFFDMNGLQLQDFENLEVEMSQICFSVIPTELGGAAIFSWLDSSNSAPEKFFSSVSEVPDLTSSVIHAIFDNTENFAINPSWYEELSNEDKQYIFSRIILFEQSISYAENCRPDQSARPLADWGQGIISSF